MKPHRMQRYRASNDPQFEEKAAAIIGLYLNPGSSGPAPAAISRSGREAWIRILSPRNAAVVCCADSSYWGGQPTPYQPGIRRVPGRGGRHPAGRPRGARHAARQRDSALHADLFLLVESGRKLVQQAAAGRNRPRNLHLRRGPEAQNPPLLSVFIRRPPNHSSGNTPMFANGSSVVAMAQGLPTSSGGVSASVLSSYRSPPHRTHYRCGN